MKRLHTPTVIRNIVIKNDVTSMSYKVYGIVCAEDRPWTVEDLIRWLPNQISYDNISTVTGPGVNFIKKQFIGTGYIILVGDTFQWTPEEVRILEDNWHNIESDEWNYQVNR